MAVRWPAKRGDIPALFRGDQTISGDWTFTGDVSLADVQIDGTLTIGNGNSADQDILINFNIDRGWVFKVEGEDAAAHLALQSTAGGAKMFYIQDDHGTNVFELRPYDYTFRINDETGVDYASFGHDGTNFNTTFVGTTAWNISGAQVIFGDRPEIATTTPYLYFDETDQIGGDERRWSLGPGTRVFQLLTRQDDDTAAYQAMAFTRANNSTAIETARIAADNAILLAAPAITYGNGHTMLSSSATIADDGTATFNVGGTYSMVIITNNRAAGDYAHIGMAGTLAPVDLGSGATVAMGATNPDTDGRVNLWPSASGVLSIKNRMGSSRTFYVTAFSNEA